jgi:hypothetical protein
MAHTYPCQDNRLFLLVASASVMAPVTQLVLNWPSSRNKNSKEQQSQYAVEKKWKTDWGHSCCLIGCF